MGGCNIHVETSTFGDEQRLLNVDIDILGIDKMTSRLKHKLELENINLKSAYLNESFVQVSHTRFGGSN